MTVTTTSPPSAAPAAGGRTSAITVALVALAVFLSAVTAFGAATGAMKLALLPVAAVAAVGLGYLAVTQFASFVFMFLVIRASLDLFGASGVTAAGAAKGSSFDPATMLGGLFIVAAAVWLAAQLHAQGRLTVPGSPLRRALIAFLIAGTLSVAGSGSPKSSIQTVFKILAAVIFYVVLEQLMVREETMRTLLKAIFVSAIFPLAYTLFGLATGTARTEQKSGFSRIIGTFSQSNDFARYLMVIILLGTALWPHVDSTYRKCLAVLLLISGACMMLTLALAPVAATAVGLVIIGFAQNKKIVLALLVAAVIGMLAVPSLAQRSVEIVTGTHSTSAWGQSNSLQWRFKYWGQVLPLANHNPITGIGLDTTQNLTDQSRQPHNDYLRAYVETGLIGLLCYLAVILSMLKLAVRATRRSLAGTYDRGVAVAFLAITVGFALNSLVANVFSSVVFLVYLFTVAAAAGSVLYRRAERDRALEAILTEGARSKAE